MIPLRTDYQMTRTPVVNYALVILNVVLFVIGVNGGNPKVIPLMLDPYTPQLYQFFTSAFMHQDIMHLLGNMVFLWVFGNGVNDRFGHTGYLAFYLSGAVLAGAGFMMLGASRPMLGASGAISAVTGAYLVLLPRVRVTLLNIIYIITTFEISSLYFLLFQFVFNMWMSFHTGGPGGGVAYAAHSSGYVFGIAVTGLLLATKLLPRDALDLLNLIHSARRRHRYRQMVGAGYDPFNPVSSEVRSPAPKWVEVTASTSAPADTPAGRELQLRREITEVWQQHDLPAACEKYLKLVQIADDAVLPQAQQLDVANQLMAAEQYPAAADAYQRFLKHYPLYEHIGDIYLMLGLLHSRYLHQYDQAEQSLLKAIELLHDERKLQLARGDLQALRQRR